MTRTRALRPGSISAKVLAKIGLLRIAGRPATAAAIAEDLGVPPGRVGHAINNHAAAGRVFHAANYGTGKAAATRVYSLTADGVAALKRMIGDP